MHYFDYRIVKYKDGKIRKINLYKQGSGIIAIDEEGIKHSINSSLKINYDIARLFQVQVLKK
jgi:predicted transcriptional regulator